MVGLEIVGLAIVPAKVADWSVPKVSAVVVPFVWNISVPAVLPVLTSAVPEVSPAAIVLM